MKDVLDQLTDTVLTIELELNEVNDPDLADARTWLIGAIAKLGQYIAK